MDLFYRYPAPYRAVSFIHWWCADARWLGKAGTYKALKARAVGRELRHATMLEF